jgi:hypothetical protein
MKSKLSNWIITIFSTCFHKQEQFDSDDPCLILSKPRYLKKKFYSKLTSSGKCQQSSHILSQVAIKHLILLTTPVPCNGIKEKGWLTGEP